MEWQVYSRLERKIVAKIQTAGGAEQVNFTSAQRPSLPDYLTNRALDQNIRALANSPEFRAAISAGAASFAPIHHARRDLPDPAEGNGQTTFSR